MRRFTWGGGMLLLIAGCTGAGPTTNPSFGSAEPSSTVSASAPPAGRTTISAGCGGTAILTGTLPAWTASAQVSQLRLPFVLAPTGDVVGILWGYPFRTGHPSPSNKILWIVKEPRDGKDLSISMHPDGATSPSAVVTQPADSSPGEIYPSIIDVPAGPGCWRLDLTWNGHSASVALPYCS